ncbi:MAG: hypothetical protein GY915_04325 [bacterium]|nr:hypothetical protein [bacterium]
MSTTLQHSAPTANPKEPSRFEKVRVRYLDTQGASQEIEAGGLLSFCLQHELDHIDGVLFIDRLSSLKRAMLRKKLSKLKNGKL